MRIGTAVAISYLVVAAATLPSLDGCPHDGCPDDLSGFDESSLLALRGILRQDPPTPVPGMNASETEATKFYYVLCTQRNSKTAMMWDSAQSDVMFCQLTMWEYESGLVKENCTNMDELMDALAAVPIKQGYKTTLDMILWVGTQYQTSSITSYSATYAMQDVVKNKVVSFQLYAETYSAPQQLIIDDMNITNFHWRANCGDITCVGSPNVLSWNRTKGNPTSGWLNFAYITPFDDLPENAYVGPYFFGEISDTATYLKGSTNANQFGVVFQNDVIHCGPLPTSPDEIVVDPGTFMKAGAPQACLQGVYCVQLNGKFNAEIYNMTVGADSLALGGVKMKDYELRDSNFAWNHSGDMAYDGSVLFSTNATSGNKLIGKIAHKNGTLYNLTGYIPTSGEACWHAPPLPHMSGWEKFKNGKLQTIINGGLAALGFVAVQTILEHGLMPLFGKMYGTLKDLINRWFSNKDNQDEAESSNEEVDCDDATAREPSPEEKAKMEEANEHARKAAQEEANGDQAGADAEAMQEKLDSIDEMLQMEDLPEQQRAQLESMQSELQMSQQQKLLEQEESYLRQADYAEASADALEEAEDIADAEAEARETYEEEKAAEMDDEAGDSNADDVDAGDVIEADCMEFM